MANDRPSPPAHAGSASAGRERSRPDRVAASRPARGRSPRDASFIERQLRQKKRARLWRGLALLLFLLGAGGVAYITFTQHGRDTMGAIRTATNMAVTAKTNPNLIFDEAGSDHVNILLIGRDVNYKMSKVYDPKTGQMRPYHVYDEDASARSDTMIVVSLDRRHNTIRMVSFPRDAMVHLPPNKEGVRRAKLNAAHAYGGPELLMQTMRDELGLTIHHYAVIRFEGFKKLIDQMGGIEVNVLGALHRDGTRGRLKYDDDWGNLHIDLEPGKQWLDGQAAHNYVRFRMDIEGDPGRIRRQQSVMRALAKRIMQQPFYKIPALVQEVRRQFKTDLNEEEIASAAAFAHNIGDASKIQPITLYGTYGHRGSLILNEPRNKKLLAYIFGPTFNPDLFLHRSPSTRRHDVGGEDMPNPAVHALLREAGLIDGEPPLHADARDALTEESAARHVTERENAISEVPSRFADRYELPVYSTEAEAPRTSEAAALSVEAPEPRRRTRERTRPETRPARDESEDVERERSRASTPRRVETESQPSGEEYSVADAPVADAPPARRPARRALEAPPARRELSVESPVPEAESVVPAPEE